ncbi:unnamed protein product [Scytosiphon promiscuus]
MSMEDGGELEGTFECSNRASGRLRNREGVPAEGLDRLLARHDGAADSDGAGGSSLAERRKEGRTPTPPREQSPLPWQHQEEQGGGSRGGTVASSVARFETAAAQPSSELSASAGGYGASGAGVGVGGSESSSGGNSRSVVRPRPTLASTAATPPSTASAAATPRNADARASSSAPIRLASPLRSQGGLQVQSLGAEAAEIFSTEALLETASEGQGYDRLHCFLQWRCDSSDFLGRSPWLVFSARFCLFLRAARVIGRVSRMTQPGPLSSSSSFLSSFSPLLVPRPPSPPLRKFLPSLPISRNSHTPTFDTRFQNAAAATPSPSQTSSAATAPGATPPSFRVGRTAIPPVAQRVDGAGGGEGCGGGAGNSSYESAREEEKQGGAEEGATEPEVTFSRAVIIAGSLKACESGTCTLEACWGDPRFRPRYCARHKKQGSKLMDPVEQEEGEKAAAPEERFIPPEALPEAVDDPSGQLEKVNRLGTCNLEHACRMLAMSSGVQDDPEMWDYTTVVVRKVPPSGVNYDAASSRHGARVIFGSRGGSFPGHRLSSTRLGLRRIPSLPVRHRWVVGTREDDMDEDEDGVRFGVSSSGRQTFRRGQPSGSVAQEEEVQARVAAYGRLAGKKVQVPSLPKPRAQKAKKRPSGSNIADFYGGGESDEEDEETAFNMDAYSKGVLLSQAAEVGTHTEDGQLRPQPSQERDQQRLAHLMRVGKLGSALRGKGVSAVGKRR